MTIWLQETVAAVGMLIFVTSAFVLAIAGDTLLA
jgi:hypothetical protein